MTARLGLPVKSATQRSTIFCGSQARRWHLQDRRVHIRSDGHIKSDQSSAEKKRLVRSHLEPYPLKSARAASGVGKRETYSK